MQGVIDEHDMETRRDGFELSIDRNAEVPIGVQYMVLKSGDVGPPWTEAKSRRAMARVSGDADLARVYPVIAELPLPDGSVATPSAAPPWV